MVTVDPARMRALHEELVAEKKWRRWMTAVLLVAAIVVAVCMGGVVYVVLGNRSVVCENAADDRKLVKAVADAAGLDVKLPSPPEGCPPLDGG